MTNVNINRVKTSFLPHGLIYTILSFVIICLTVLTIVYSILWRNIKASSNIYSIENGIIGHHFMLPNDGKYIQWSFLQMNDVYELLPLDRGRKGGLARVAYIRKLLKQENSNTYTILAGDFLSPSALSLSIINGTTLNGKQMIAVMNTLGVDYAIFGNHEFDLNEKDLLTRMNESTFTWISTNVFRQDNNQLFGSIDYVQEYLKLLPNNTYDVFIAITHLDMATDIDLASKIPQLNLIMGGHEHDNFNYLRGTNYIPINKADANAFTVFIHRCAYNIDTKRFRLYSTLAQVTYEVPNEENTEAIANYWFNLGIQGFQTLGYNPNAIVSCLPTGIELDGRSASVRSHITLLTAEICESMLELTATYRTTIGIVNGGTVRIDDILRETISEYDIIRTLPFVNQVIALSVPGQIIAQVLTTGMSLKGNGMFMAYTRVETLDGGKTWLFNGIDISKTGLSYNVATLDYVRDNTALNHSDVNTLYDTNITHTRALMIYLKNKYPPC
ncbi:unnamed protein product [Rotaria sp. Silwood2]|nr:unnamed protein product [Rotaria sp. Silwood2]